MSSKSRVLEKLAVTMKYCKRCNTLFLSSQNVCSNCRSKEFEKDHQKVLLRIERDPYLRDY